MAYNWNAPIIETRTPLAETYEGHAETCEWEFHVWGPDQFQHDAIVRDRIIDAHITELQQDGSELLDLTVWEDSSPTWQTNFYVRTSATASPLFWTPIIIGILVIIALIVIYRVVHKVTEYDWPSGVTEAIQWVAIATIAGCAVAALYIIKKKQTGG